MAKLIPNLAPIDKKAIEELGIPGLLLMEEAGRAVADRTEALARELGLAEPRILILCGSGNNGGDGYVCARHLAMRQVGKVTVLHTVAIEQLQGDALANFEQLPFFPVRLQQVETLSPVQLALENSDLVVDALFGSGLSRPVTGLYHDIITALNDSGLPVIAVDMPSGVRGETGAVMGVAVQARETVTFAAAKPAFYLYPGKALTGNLVITDIGIPPELVEADPSRIFLIDDAWAAAHLPRRHAQSHKYDYGNVVVLGGSRSMPGAVCMTAEATLRAGAGLVRLATAKSAFDGMPLPVEVIRIPLPEDTDGWLGPEAMETLLPHLERATTLVIGPGMGCHPGTVALVEKLLSWLLNGFAGTVVLDADGLNCLSQLKNPPALNSRFILTPHVGECARLISLDKDRIEADLPGAAQKVYEMFGAVVVLKSAATVVYGGEMGAWINATGNPGMATAGSGDVLTGIIAGFAAQKLSPTESARLAVFLHGRSGDRAVEALTPYCLIATDLIRYLPDAIHSLQRT